MIFLYLCTFRKSVIQVSLKPDNNDGHLKCRTINIFEDISLNFSQNEKCFRQKVIQKIKTHILCLMTFFSIEYRAVCNTYCLSSKTVPFV